MTDGTSEASAGFRQNVGFARTADADVSRPDCWGHIAAYGWDRDDGFGVDGFR